MCAVAEAGLSDARSEASEASLGASEVELFAANSPRNKDGLVATVRRVRDVVPPRPDAQEPFIPRSV